MNEEPKPTPTLCAHCGKKIKKDHWYKIMGHEELFCNLNCLTHWEETHG